MKNSLITFNPFSVTEDVNGRIYQLTIKGIQKWDDGEMYKYVFAHMGGPSINFKKYLRIKEHKEQMLEQFYFQIISSIILRKNIL